MKSFVRDEDGSAFIFAGVFLPVLAAVGMFAVDLSHIYLAHDRMKVATDAAAVGAALILSEPEAATHRAIGLAAANVDPSWGTVTTEEDVEYGTYDPAKRTFTPGTASVNAVRVSAHRSAQRGNAMPTYFAALLGTTSVEIAATSIAVQVASTCVVVLDPSADAALSLSGSGAMNVPNCNVQVNSDSASALSITGGSLSAKSICLGGESQGGGTTSPAPVVNCRSLADPLANLAEPGVFGCRQTSPMVINSLGSDCTYSGTVRMDGNVHLGAGVYYFQNAEVRIASGARVTGSDVLLFLDAGSTLTMEPGSGLALGPTETGPYAGLSLFQSRAAEADRVSQIGGADGSVAMGAIYMPTAHLAVAGSAETGKIVVGRLSANGDGTLTVRSPANRYAITPQRPTNQRTTLVY